MMRFMTTENTHAPQGGNCVFCKIAAKEIPAQIVYEDAETMAFLDINPNTHGHTLVICKDNFENLYTLPQELLCRMMMTVQKLAVSIKAATNADGLSIIMNTEYACHMKDHAHIHIIPRHENDGITEWPHQAYIGDEMEKMAEKVRKEIDN